MQLQTTKRRREYHYNGEKVSKLLLSSSYGCARHSFNVSLFFCPLTPCSNYVTILWETTNYTYRRLNRQFKFLPPSSHLPLIRFLLTKNYILCITRTYLLQKNFDWGTGKQAKFEIFVVVLCEGKIIINTLLAFVATKLRKLECRLYNVKWRWSLGTDWLIAPGAYPSFCSTKWLGVFLLPGC